MVETDTRAPDERTAEHGEAAVTDSPVAVVAGQPLDAFPQDLYIPPDALEIFLETFEGPLDLLLYLIKKQNLDILDIPVALITEQYMSYIEFMQGMRLELAGDYLVMASILAEIKSRMLLPRPETVDDDESDPRADLIRRLQEYERIKQAAEDLDALPRVARDLFPVTVACPEPPDLERPLPDVDLRDLITAFQAVLARSEAFAHHHVQRETLSVREKMSMILATLRQREHIEFAELLLSGEGRLGVVVTFFSVLELAKEALIELQQTAPFAPIYVRVPDVGRSAVVPAESS